MGLLPLVEQAEAGLVKEAELGRWRGRMTGIHTHIKVKDVEECTGISMKKWDTLGLKDIPDVGDI